MMNLERSGKTMIFDTHAHYDDEAFDSDREEILRGLKDYGIGRVVNVGSSLATCKTTIKLMENHPNVYGAIGVHPSETTELTEESFSWLEEQLTNPKCLAVGEIGLDYYFPEPERDIQKKWFIRQLNMARRNKLPVIIHSREAAQDTMDIMKEEHAEEIGGVIHCFSYSPEVAQFFLDMGFYIGIGGVVTFKNAKKVKETVAATSIERIVLETDCPYLAPDPNRGKRNSSLNIPYVIEQIAQIKNMDPKDVEMVTWENAEKLYKMI